MINLVVRADGAAPLLVETLSPLVEGVVRGLVGKLFLVVTSTTPDVEAVAQEAGADLIVGQSWAQGLQQVKTLAKTPWVLCIDIGVIAEPSLWQNLERYIKLGNGVAATQPELDFAAQFIARITRFRGKVSSAQMVLMRLQDIKGDVWGEYFGKALSLLPTRSRRLKF